MKKYLYILFLLVNIKLHAQNIISYYKNLDTDTKYYMLGLGMSSFNGYTLYNFTDKISLSLVTAPITPIIYGLYINKQNYVKYGNTVIWGSAVGGLSLMITIDNVEKHHPHNWLYEDEKYNNQNPLDTLGIKKYKINTKTLD